MDSVRSWLMTAHPTRTPALSDSLSLVLSGGFFQKYSSVWVDRCTAASRAAMHRCCIMSVSFFGGKMEYFGRADATDASNCTLDQEGYSSRTEEQQLEAPGQAGIPWWWTQGEDMQVDNWETSAHKHTGPIQASSNSGKWLELLEDNYLVRCPENSNSCKVKSQVCKNLFQNATKVKKKNHKFQFWSPL